MRTLKKTLCLVLAVVLCFGLVGTAFAGNFDDFTDADKVSAEYKEAMDVFIGLKIVEGDAKMLDPAGNYTRAAAAKIMALTVGGPSVEYLQVSTNAYKDVSADYWAMRYIAYCQSMNLMEGYGDGNFGPNDPITGQQMAILCLRSVGYGANKEYSGADWALVGSRDALKQGIFDDALIADGANSAKALTREQAIQMAFITMTDVKCVEYNELLKSYIQIGTSYVGQSGAPRYLASNYSLSRPTSVVAGVNGHTWYSGTVKDANKVSDWYVDDVVVDTLTGPVTKATLAAKYTANDFVAAVAYWYNGAQLADFVWADFNNAPAGVFVPAGSVAVLYDVADANDEFDGKVDKIVVTEEYIGVVNTANATAKTCDVIGNFGVVTMANTKGFVKGDVLLTTPLYTDPGFNATKFLSAAKVDKSFTGMVTAVGTDVSYVKVDGKTYYLSENILAGAGVTLTASGLVGGTFDFYLDSTGAVAYVCNPVAAAALNYCYVTESKGSQGSPILGQAGYARAQMVKTDGTAAYVNIYSYTKNGALTVVNAAGNEVNAADNVITAGYYSYVEKADGSFQFTALDGNKAVGLTDTQKVGVTAKSPLVTGTGSGIATSATVLNVANKGSVTTKTGYANWSTKEYEAEIDASAPETYILVTKTSGVVTSINVFSSAVAATTTYGYYYGQLGETTAAGTAYKFYVDGAVKDYIVTNAASVVPTAGNVYVMTVTSETEATIADATTLLKGAVVESVDTGYFTVEGNADDPQILGATCKVYDVTTAGTVTEGTLVAGTATTHGNVITYVYSTTNNIDTVAVVYITGPVTTK